MYCVHGIFRAMNVLPLNWSILSCLIHPKQESYWLYSLFCFVLNFSPGLNICLEFLRKLKCNKHFAMYRIQGHILVLYYIKQLQICWLYNVISLIRFCRSKVIGQGHWVKSSERLWQSLCTWYLNTRGVICSGWQMKSREQSAETQEMMPLRLRIFARFP